MSARAEESSMQQDPSAYLVWPQAPDPTTRTWREAMEKAECLKLAGYDDRRWPKVRKLFSSVMKEVTPQALVAKKVRSCSRVFSES